MSSMSYILNLDQINSEITELVGGKAMKLGEMMKHGFRIPEGIVLTTNAYSEIMKESSVHSRISQILQSIDYDDANSLNAAAEAIEDVVMELKIPSQIEKELKQSYDALSQQRVAVRSSATAEDLEEASFAGQYDTFLNVSNFSSLLTHIKRCYASVWTPRAISYRHKNGIPNETMKLAVLIQSMVDADKAGVLFTDDPTVPSKVQMLIEANFGLGESVVSGIATPDRYVISRKDNPNYKENKLLFSEIGTKDVIIYSGGESSEGVNKQDTTEEISQRASLSEEESLELARIGQELEILFETPQDIEWAIDTSGTIHVLQSRPITVQRHDECNEILWSRGYSDDYWNDNVTPLFFDLLGDQIKYIVNIELNQIMGYKDMPSEILKLYKAHAYFNLEVIRNKVVNEIPPFLRSDDVLNYFPEGSGPFGKETMRELPFATASRVMAEIRVMLLDSQGSMTKTAEEYYKWTDEIFIPYLSSFDEELDMLVDGGSTRELWNLAAELDKVMMGHFRMVRYGIPVHNIGMNLVVNYMLRRWLGENRATKLFPLLVIGLDHKTNETNLRLNQLAEKAQTIPEIKQSIIETPSEDLQTKLNQIQSPEAREFMKEFEVFLADFGVRGHTREPYYSRWNEKPSLVFDILKPLVQSDRADISVSEERIKQMRSKAEKEVEEGIKKTRNSRIKLMLFNTILGMSRKYIAFRENQRFNLDRWITRNRRLFLQIGKRFVEEGLIESDEHIFFLFRKEIKRIILDRYPSEELESLKKKVLDRYEEFKENEDVTPPKFIQGSRIYNDRLVHSDDDKVLKGLPASQGVLTGKVRILRKVEEIPYIKEGEILVVPKTDPGWTPVFSQIGGLVTETGGILSHGAVVSREYCIPAVTNIRKACDILKTGQTITIDGNSGIITFQDESEG